jgi:hypothetical protein
VSTYQSIYAHYNPTYHLESARTSSQAPMAYTPSTGSYVPIHQQSPEAFTATPHTSRAPPLPGAALYRRKLLEQSAFPSQNNSRAISSTRALKMTAPKHSTSPPPSSQDRKVRRINDSKIQQFHGRSHSPAPEQSIGMSDSTRGTQHNPMEILSSPEPEPVRTSYTKKILCRGHWTRAWNLHELG